MNAARLNLTPTVSFASMPNRPHLADSAQQWLKAILLVALFLAICALCTHALASDGAEFADSASKFEGWVKGNLGKTAAFVCLGFGAIVAGLRKDWSWFIGAVGISMGVGIIAGIINASFTAIV